MPNLMNTTENTFHYEFIVARKIDGNLWYWGAYRDGWKADQVAYDIGGVVIHNVKIQGYQP